VKASVHIYNYHKTHSRITNWIDREVPKLSSWEEIKELRLKISQRIELEWDEERRCVKKLEDELYEEVKREFTGLEDKIGKIEQDLSMSRTSGGREEVRSSRDFSRGKHTLRKMSRLCFSSLNVHAYLPLPHKARRRNWCL
jgi:hypothetical protein